MHRIDEKLMKLDAHFEAANGEEKQSIQKEIKVWGSVEIFLLRFLGGRMDFRMDIWDGSFNIISKIPLSSVERFQPKYGSYVPVLNE